MATITKPKEYILKQGQRPHPVIMKTEIELPEGFIYPTDEQLLKVFKTKGYTLQSWGRDPNNKKRIRDPHWLAIRGGTTLRTDPRYPRYSHHLKIRIDGKIGVHGMNPERVDYFKRGTFYILDTHSPHKVIGSRSDYNVSIVWDNDAPTNPKKVIETLINYGKTAPFLINEDIY